MPQQSKQRNQVVYIISRGFLVPLYDGLLTFMTSKRKVLPRIWVAESDWSAEIQSNMAIGRPLLDTSIEEGLAR